MVMVWSSWQIIRWIFSNKPLAKSYEAVKVLKKNIAVRVLRIFVKRMQRFDGNNFDGRFFFNQPANV